MVSWKLAPMDEISANQPDKPGGLSGDKNKMSIFSFITPGMRASVEHPCTFCTGTKHCFVISFFKVTGRAILR